MRITIIMLTTLLVAGCVTSPKGNAVIYEGSKLMANEGVIHVCRMSSLVGALGGSLTRPARRLPGSPQPVPSRRYGAAPERLENSCLYAAQALT